MYSTNLFASGGKTKFTKQQIVGIVVVCVIIVGFLVSKFIFQPSSAEVQAKAAEVIKQGDIAKCDSFDGKVIEGVDYGAVCRNNISTNLATQNLDPSYCDKLDETMMSVLDCKRTVVQAKLQKTGDVTICNFWTDESMKANCVNFYWRNKAIQSNDVAFCRNSTDDNANSFCVGDVLIGQLISNPRSTRCANFPTSMRSDCTAYQDAQRKPTTISNQCIYTHPMFINRFCTVTF
ncbi:MAG: hypothetical protein AAB795_01950 [Patescibacteria group bacterium]